MPTIFTHVAVPVCATIALGTRRVPPSALLVGMLAAIVPDFDGLAFKLGIAYGGMTGHRGFTHTLMFALVFGLLGCWLAPRWRMRRTLGWAWVALCTLSHPLLDMLTNGGIGIALFWPFDSTRYFSPWRPIEVSPVAIKRFLSPRGAQVLLNEIFIVWAPLLGAAVIAMAIRRTVEPRIAPSPR
ncbi:metal-dependent hydrolase [Variovorax sp. YR566]|uniref:metal-dependent hydrolase n=1 Tax=Variovorax sp. YR566 TaxID=3450237 RepID=UPI003F817FA4